MAEPTIKRKEVVGSISSEICEINGGFRWSFSRQGGPAPSRVCTPDGLTLVHIVVDDVGRTHLRLGVLVLLLQGDGSG